MFNYFWCYLVGRFDNFGFIFFGFIRLVEYGGRGMGGDFEIGEFDGFIFVGENVCIFDVVMDYILFV